MQRKPGDGDDALLVSAEQAVDLAFTDPRRAAALAAGVRGRSGAGPEARAVALRAAGLVAVGRGELAEAARSLREAIDVAEHSGLAFRGAEARASLSYVLTLTGRTVEALAEVDRAGSVLEGVKGAQLRMQRALILTELGLFDEAEAGFADALRALRRAGGSPLVEGDVHTNRSLLHARRRYWRAADDDLDRAAELYKLAGHPGRLANVEHNRGTAAVARGDVPSALLHFDAAEALLRSQDRDLGLIPLERAQALLSVRLNVEARAAAEEAVSGFERAQNAVDLVEARLVLARAALAGGDPGTARAEADRARRSAVRQQRPGWAALAAYVALRARWDGGERGESMVSAGRRVLPALLGTGWAVAAADVRLLVARLLLDLGRTDPARRLLEEAAGVRRRGPAELQAAAWHAEALLRLAGGDRRGADAALATAIAVLDRFRAGLGATELRAHVSSLGAEVADLGMTLALRSGRPASVLRWAERWRAGALLLPPARPPQDASLAADVGELRQVAREAEELAARGGDTVPLLERQAKLERAIRERSRHAPGSGAAATGSPVRQLAAALGGAVLAEFVSSDGELSAVVLQAGRPRLVRLGPVSAVTPAVDALRFGMRRLAFGWASPASLDAAEALVERSARELDDRLIVPLGIPGAIDVPLVLVPTGALHSVPWAVLPSCAGRAVSVTPSAALWLRAAAVDRPGTVRSQRRVFVAGPGLAHATAEVTALTRGERGVERYTGRQARVDAVARAMDGAGVVHVAAHGSFRADNPAFSSLELADGPLTVFDLERLSAPPAYVVLSACDSAVAGVHPGDELIGLAAALLGMGTRSLVASVLPVGDDASVPLMRSFHHRFRGGDAPAAALAGAQRELSGPEQDRRTRLAAAGFVCLGAG